MTENRWTVVILMGMVLVFSAGMLVAVDPAWAGPITDFGKNLKDEIGGGVKEIFPIVVGLLLLFMWWQRMYIPMAIALLVAGLIAPFIYAPVETGAMLKKVGQSLLPGGGGGGAI